MYGFDSALSRGVPEGRADDAPLRIKFALPRLVAITLRTIRLAPSRTRFRPPGVSNRPSGSINLDKTLGFDRKFDYLLENYDLAMMEPLNLNNEHRKDRVLNNQIVDPHSLINRAFRSYVAC